MGLRKISNRTNTQELSFLVSGLVCSNRVFSFACGSVHTDNLHTVCMISYGVKLLSTRQNEATVEYSVFVI